VLFVSHDRFFIEELADRVLELSCGASPRLYYGDYTYYLSKKAEAAETGTAGAAEKPQAAPGKPRMSEAQATDARPTDAKATRELDKRRKVERNRHRKREEEILSRLEGIEAEKSALIAAMASPANYSDGSKMKALQASSDALEAEAASLSGEWETVAQELEGYADLD